MDKKCVLIQPLQSNWKAPSPTTKWTNNAFSNFTRLAQADAYHINSSNIDMTADIYHICSYDISLLEKEIEFANTVKNKGAKVVTGFSSDLRFLLGHCLMNNNGALYSELSEVSDVILSAINPELRLYGRYQDKVMGYGVPFERLNFSTIPFESRTIDLLISGSAGEEGFSFTIETLLLLKEKFPNKRIVYSIGEDFKFLYSKYSDKFEFSKENLLYHLPNSKAYYNPELRPRPGRPLIEAFYCRTPFISCGWSFHTKLFPDFAYINMDMYNIVDLYQKLLDSNYNEIIAKAELIAEEDYFENFYPRLLQRLYG